MRFLCTTLALLGMMLLNVTSYSRPSISSSVSLGNTHLYPGKFLELSTTVLYSGPKYVVSCDLINENNAAKEKSHVQILGGDFDDAYIDGKAISLGSKTVSPFNSRGAELKIYGVTAATEKIVMRNLDYTDTFFINCIADLQ